MPLGLTPLAKAAGMSNAETVSALLRLRCDPNPPLCGLGVTPMISGVALARGNSSSVQIVHALLEGRADPNVVSRQSGMWLTMVAVGRAKARRNRRRTCFNHTQKRQIRQVHSTEPLAYYHFLAIILLLVTREWGNKVPYIPYILIWYLIPLHSLLTNSKSFLPQAT